MDIGARFIHALPAGVRSWMAGDAASATDAARLYRLILAQPGATAEMEALKRMSGLGHTELGKLLFLLNRSQSVAVDVQGPLQTDPARPTVKRLMDLIERISESIRAPVVLADVHGLCVASAGLPVEGAQALSAQGVKALDNSAPQTVFELGVHVLGQAFKLYSLHAPAEQATLTTELAACLLSLCADPS